MIKHLYVCFKREKTTLYIFSLSRTVCTISVFSKSTITIFRSLWLLFFGPFQSLRYQGYIQCVVPSLHSAQINVLRLLNLLSTVKITPLERHTCECLKNIPVYWLYPPVNVHLTKESTVFRGDFLMSSYFVLFLLRRWVIRFPYSIFWTYKNRFTSGIDVI